MSEITYNKTESRVTWYQPVSETFNFGKRRIGKGEPVFIIAECGINHGGDIGVAEEMIRKAAECQASAVKFQTYVTEKRVPADSPVFDILKQCELDETKHRRLKELAESCGIEFFSTPFDAESVAMLEELNVPGYKIASFDIVNQSLLRSVSESRKPVICSTGMANEAEVRNAIEIFSSNLLPFALLHCVSAYPTEISDANLRVINTLKSLYSGPVGYSDHTLGVKVPVLAAAVGAQVIEKHFTLDKNADGPDHKLSADVEDLRKMVNEIREVEMIMGENELTLIETERPTLVFRRPSE
ncbi:MAG: hypothetical protein GF307_13830 [candidate division Zixibacteria bacterium]|nr:hypothetical protein [candidate division Zixibacteria bacterium]